jgi:hypothetical protein
MQHDEPYATIDARLRQLTGVDMKFGGIAMILIGISLPLPVKQTSFGLAVMTDDSGSEDDSRTVYLIAEQLIEFLNLFACCHQNSTPCRDHNNNCFR